MTIFTWLLALVGAVVTIAIVRDPVLYDSGLRFERWQWPWFDVREIVA